jgi:hypothetical protein
VVGIEPNKLRDKFKKSIGPEKEVIIIFEKRRPND